MHVLHAATGAPFWQVTARDSIRSSPVLCTASGRVLCGSHDGHIYVMDAAARCLLACLNPNAAAAATSPSTASASASPALAASSLVSDDTLGPIAAGLALGCHGNSNGTHSSTHCCYGATLRGHVFALELPRNTGQARILWRYRLPKPVFATPALAPAGGVLLVAAVDGALSALAAMSGDLLWRCETGAPIFCPPLLLRLSADQHNAAAAGATLPPAKRSHHAHPECILVDAVVFGCNDGRIRAVTLATGAELWASADLGAQVVACPLVLPCAPDDASERIDTIVVAAADGSLHVLSLAVNGKEHMDRSSQRALALGQPVFSSPVAVCYGGQGARIVVGCRDDHLHGIDLHRCG